MKIPKSIILAIIGLTLGITYVFISEQDHSKPLPLKPIVESPYKKTVAGVGLIESLDDNINVYPYRNGRVEKVFVREGDKVKKGDPLYQLDVEDLKANFASLNADCDSQQIKIERLKNEPRSEDIPPLKAQIQDLQANYDNLKIQYERFNNISDNRAIKQDDLTQKYYEMNQAEARLLKGKADLKKLLAGAWSYDIRQAQTDYKSLKAKSMEINTIIKQSLITAPADAQILQVNIRPGSFISTTNLTSSPPVILGNNKKLQIRVDIDEIDASKVKPGSNATAFVRGEPKKQFPLQFVRIEPYMIPKQNLSGSSTERVDVRVLQLIYEFDPPKFPVYVGQQVDVYIENKS